MLQLLQSVTACHLNVQLLYLKFRHLLCSLKDKKFLHTSKMFLRKKVITVPSNHEKVLGRAFYFSTEFFIYYSKYYSSLFSHIFFIDISSFITFLFSL